MWKTRRQTKEQSNRLRRRSGGAAAEETLVGEKTKRNRNRNLNRNKDGWLSPPASRHLLRPAKATCGGGVCEAQLSAAHHGTAL
jgi:hypothetical protein